jgi:ankyrin repeat protein
MTSPLPERANLAQLKKQAKSLLHAARAGDHEALKRFQILPTRSRKSVAELASSGLALHDAQSVLAREYGFTSWNELREHVEEHALSFAEAAEEFVRCATGGAAVRAQRLLARHPGIAHASLYAELVLGDGTSVAARLQKQPDVARQAGGVQTWEPLLYVCHTCLHQDAPDRAAGLVAIARELVARGANPNAEYHFQWHRELPRTALWGALCVVRHLPLAEALLEAGANPTDGVSMHIVAGVGDVASLELLHRYHVDVNGIRGGVPPLRYILSWAHNDPVRAAGIRWLLEHGADPNLPWSEPGDAPIHVVAERWDVAMMDLLVRHGADIHQRRADGRTAHTLAELHGNTDVAAWLLAHGATDERTPLERFISACARGDRASADALLQVHPGLRGELGEEHHRMMHVPAERGDYAVLETMLACGFKPAATDVDGVTALHKAAMAGHAEAVRVLLAHGAPVNALDGMFAATPLVWASHGWGEEPGAHAGHLDVARLLIDAGSSREWVAPPNAPNPEQTQNVLEALCRAAEAITR